MANPSSMRSGPSPQPGRSNLNKIINGPGGRILCLADIRGQLSLINQLAQESNAVAVIHTGDFGFFDDSSLDRITDKTLKHITLYSPLIPADQRDRLTKDDNLRATIQNSTTPLLSEFPLLLSGKLKLSVPVYTVWGACEDVAILERFRSGENDVPNLHVIDEATSRTLEIGGIKLRLLGLGGAFVPHKLFDNGDGKATIAGAGGTMWTTALQIGELVDTFQKTYDASETRLLITHASQGREGYLAQLALVVKADLTISAALHFRYTSSWNDFSVMTGPDTYHGKLQNGSDSFQNVWKSVKTKIESAVDDTQKALLEKALMVSQRVPEVKTLESDEPIWKNTWNWNLCDAAFGHLVLDVKDGRVSAELKSQGFNYAYRRSPQSVGTAASTPAAHLKALPSQVASAVASPVRGASPALAPPRQESGHNSEPNGTVASGAASRALPKERSENDASSGISPANGAANGTTSPSSGVDNSGKKKKPTPAEKRERKAERERAASEAEGTSNPASPAPKHGRNKSGSKGAISPVPSAPSPAPPATGNDSDVSRVKSPKFKKPRHPWTLIAKRLPVPVSEHDVREIFGSANESITRVNLVTLQGKAQRATAFIEFKDEASMHAGLGSSKDFMLKDKPVTVAIADNRDEPNVTSDGAASDVPNVNTNGHPGSGFNRGGPHPRGNNFRGRGGRGGGGAMFELRRSLPPRKPSDGASTNDLRPNGQAAAA